MRERRILNSKKGPRFKGFVAAPLFELEHTIKLPNHISSHHPHNCFGYRALQQSFEGIEFLQEAIDLCGPDLGCGPLRSPSPIQFSTSPIRIKSPSPLLGHIPIITHKDFLDDAEFEIFLSQLNQQEALGEPGPSSRAKAVGYFGFVIGMSLTLWTRTISSQTLPSVYVRNLQMML